MTCPTFSDRDDGLRAEMMGPPTAQQHLRAAMRVSTDPRWVERQLGPLRDEQPPRRLGYWILATCALGLAGIVFGAIYAKASEPPRTWQVWNETTDKPWLSKKGEPATATGPTACNLSLWEVSKAAQDGTRLSCRRIEDDRRVR